MTTKRKMLQPLVRAAMILGTVGVVGWLSAASPSIGTATANGSFQVDHSRVWSNTTLFNGSLIETTIASSDLQLRGGVQMRLAANSRATVYEHRLVLEAGYGQLTSAGGYEVEARALRISAAEPDTVARIRLEGSGKVTVAAVHGALRVLNATGLLVAKLDTGNSLDLEPQAAGATAPTRASGCLLAKAGKFVMAEQITNMTLELQGIDLSGELGNRVEITGQAAASQPTVTGASLLVTVVGVRQLDKGGCTAIAKKIGATTAVSAAATGAAAAGTATGTGTAASGAGAGSAAAGAAGTASAAGISAGTVAVIGGVAAAATVGGLAAVGSLPGQSESQPSISR